MGVEELERLAKLKEKGAITQEEFESQKKEILANFAEDEVTKTGTVRDEFVPCSPAEEQSSISISSITGSIISIFSIIGDIIRICFGILCVLTIYFAPTGIALCRKRLNTSSVFMLNLFLGWTLIAWVIALCWAFSSDVVDVYKKMQK